MSRLASLKGPSSPSPTPIRPPISPKSTGPSYDPTPFHRKIRLILIEFEKALRDWEQVVLADGIKAGKGCVDSRTELDNLGVKPNEPYPFNPTPSSLLIKLSSSKQDLDSVLTKLQKRLFKFAALSELAEDLLLEALKLKGVEFATITPLWVSWSLQDYVNSLPPLLTSLSLSLSTLRSLSLILQSSSASFETSKSALEAWQREGFWEGTSAEPHPSSIISSSKNSRQGLGRVEWEETMAVDVKAWELGFGNAGSKGPSNP